VKLVAYNAKEGIFRVIPWNQVNSLTTASQPHSVDPP
jgi:hypothetical protein